MKVLNHLKPADHHILSQISDNWPFQFVSEFTRFHKYYFNETVNIIYDEELNAYMPLRILDMKLFAPAQILYAPLRESMELSKEEQMQFFNKLIRLLQNQGGCERLVQPHPYSILSAIPEGAKYCDFGTYVVDLENQTIEQILEKFHPKYQKAVTHSEKNGAVVKIGKECLNDFFMIYKSTMERAGLHLDEFTYFQSLYDYLGENRISCGVVYDQDEPISGIFVIHTLYGAFLTHAGTRGDSKLYGAAKLLNLEMMRHLKEKGVKKYDFVGVRLKNNNPALEGIFRFKKGFGGDLKEGYLWKIDILPLKAKAYDLMVKLKSGNDKLTDIIDQVNT
ncbi:MAG: peptidoglycan bridge formation glycyltransferase FemA/FemB family protein [Bacteroidia bacterium]|nr:peptidoglycan bridge formation glycyltransferase FemA/FemB family protein [Bacteroidia bacterium]